MDKNLEVYLRTFGKTHFEIFYDRRMYYTSKLIAKLFNIPVEIYNNTLIKKVIQHNDFEVTNDAVILGVKDFNQNVSFNQNEISKLEYIERFKEVFIEQLTTLVLGGENYD